MSAFDPNKPIDSGATKPSSDFSVPDEQLKIDAAYLADARTKYDIQRGGVKFNEGLARHRAGRLRDLAADLFEWKARVQNIGQWSNDPDGVQETIYAEKLAALNRSLAALKSECRDRNFDLDKILRSMFAPGEFLRTKDSSIIGVVRLWAGVE